MTALDWNGKLHVVNGSPLAKPFPADRLFWAVTDEGEVVEIAFNDMATLYLGRPHYSRQDGEPGCWEADDFLGWCDSYDDACEVAALYLKEAA